MNTKSIKINGKKMVVTKEDVVDILSSILGDIGYWGQITFADDDYDDASRELYNQGIDVCYEDVIVKMMEDGKRIEVYDVEDGAKLGNFTLDTIYDGLKMTAENGYDRYGYVGDGVFDGMGIDGEIADIIMQYGLLGEIVYG